MKNNLWWHKPLRVIQTNLQVNDTELMNPEKIAGEIRDMAGNVLVMNVGGIYAWYQSEIEGHVINRHLPKDFDLLEQIIVECHKLDIKVVARFDFSKTNDSVYQRHPQWFVRQIDNTPKAYGLHRPGDWSILYSTCVNGGYRNDETAVPIIDEVLRKYDIDGIFFNAPHYEFCCCQICQEKYLNHFGEEMPLKEFDKIEKGNLQDVSEKNISNMQEFDNLCVKDNIAKIYNKVKEFNEDIPLILYYNFNNDNIVERIKTADMICTEPQDVLSLGSKNIPKTYIPSVAVKLGMSVNDKMPNPFGIIHSCPGMDWRHTGLPTAEHLFWQSQIPANRGQIWQSLTGFNDTIEDKRIIENVSEINHMIKKVENYLYDAKSMAKVLLVWDSTKSAEGYADALTNTQILFDVIIPRQIDIDTLKKYELIILPDGIKYSDDIRRCIELYLEQGGNIIVEGTIRKNLANISDILGVEKEIFESEFLKASYMKFIKDDAALCEGFEKTKYIAHRGKVAYCKPLKRGEVVSTLIPPFAPLDGVGAPPERASMLTKDTDLPLCIINSDKKGKVMFLPFELGMLVDEYKLADHYTLVKNFVSYMLDKKILLHIENSYGIQASMYENDNQIILNLLNGIGERPLHNTFIYDNLEFRIDMQSNKKIKNVFTCLNDGTEVEYKVDNNVFIGKLNKLYTWETIVIETE